MNAKNDLAVEGGGIDVRKHGTPEQSYCDNRQGKSAYCRSRKHRNGAKDRRNHGGNSAPHTHGQQNHSPVAAVANLTSDRDDGKASCSTSSERKDLKSSRGKFQRQGQNSNRQGQRQLDKKGLNQTKTKNGVHKRRQQTSHSTAVAKTSRFTTHSLTTNKKNETSRPELSSEITFVVDLTGSSNQCQQKHPGVLQSQTKIANKKKASRDDCSECSSASLCHDRKKKKKSCQGHQPKSGAASVDFLVHATSSQHTAIPSFPGISVLPWPTPHHPVPLQDEMKVLPALLRWKETERGMMKDQPSFRLPIIRKKCQACGMDIMQALSLRRHHMKLLNPQAKKMSHLGLGDDSLIKEAADLFENAVEAYLVRCSVPYLTEKDQKERHYSNGRGPMPPTPDFILEGLVRLSRSNCSVGSQHKKTAGSSTASPNAASYGPPSDGTEEVNWVEAKMFYGASSIPSDGADSAMGRILEKAKKYVALYGPGAMVFSYGAGEDLVRELNSFGVAVLDSHPLDMSLVRMHQRSWCANANGVILP